MSAEKPGSRVLIIEADDQLRERLRAHFADEGYQVTAAGEGQVGLAQAYNQYPGLILLASSLPDMSGMTVFRSLREQARTAHIPVMVLAGRDEANAHKALLEEGAYDVIEKPLDLDILALRVRNALRRAEREGLSESRTGLPTGRVLDERLGVLAQQVGWYRIDLTIMEFAAFRDVYGFVTANEALRFAAGLIVQSVNEQGTPQDFVGHKANSESFVIVTTQRCGPHLLELLNRRLSSELQSFYNFVDRDQGFVLVDDGAGGQIRKPLMTPQAMVEQGPPDPNMPIQEDAQEVPSPEETSHHDDTAGSPFEW